jgi:hypothetical protein
MYSWACVTVNAAALALAAPVQQNVPALVCDAALTPLFTPRRPQIGRYEVCISTEPLTRLAEPGWKIDTVAPLDAFGGAGSLDRDRVARLFGGRRAAVARGWRRRDGEIESVTLISPHPDRELTRLEEGTLVIRYFVPE